MKNKEEKSKFPYKFGKSVPVLSAFAILLSLGGIFLSSYRIYRDGLHSFYDWLKNPFLILVCVALIVVTVSLLIKSEYVLRGKNLTAKFGLIKSTVNVNDFVCVTLDPLSGKLVAENKDGVQTVYCIAKGKGQDFVSALMKAKPDIRYEIVVGEKTDEEK